MHETIAQVLSYVWGAWRFRWLALSVAWLVALGGWLFVYKMPEAYVASARVYVDTNSVLRPLLKGLAIQPNTDQAIQMMSRTLLSRPNLEKVMRMTDLDLEVQSDAQKDALINSLSNAISLSSPRKNASLYTIEVQDEDRDVAKRVTQALITVFIESSLSEKRGDSSGAQEFLDDQIAEYEVRLVESEERLAAFKQRYVGTLPGGRWGGDYYERLENAKEALRFTELEIREAENRRNELKRQVDGEEPFLVSGDGMSPMDLRIQALSSQKDALLAKYTNLHPEVRQISALIVDLEAEKALQIEQAMSRDSDGKYPGLASSPVYQDMRSMLAATEGLIAELEVRVAEYQSRVTELEERVNNIPLIEAELKQLDRDYQVIAQQHQQLLQRRESARLSEDVGQNANDLSFRVVDPPFVPAKPSEPDKPMLNGLVLLMALGAGMAAALLASLLRPVVVDQQSLAKLTGLPLLGSVTMLVSPEEKKHDTWGLVAYSSLLVVLVVTFVGLNIGRVLLTS